MRSTSAAPAHRVTQTLVSRPDLFARSLCCIEPGVACFLTITERICTARTYKLRERRRNSVSVAHSRCGSGYTLSVSLNAHLRYKDEVPRTSPQSCVPSGVLYVLVTVTPLRWGLFELLRYSTKCWVKERRYSQSFTYSTVKDRTQSFTG